MNGFQKPRVVAVPFPALGHSIPLLDLARLLASYGLTVSYVTTPANVSRLQRSVDEAVNNGLDIRLVVFPTPVVEGLEGRESTDLLPSDSVGLIFQLAQNLQQPFNAWMDNQFEGQSQESQPPVCVIHDMFIGWAVETAQKHEIPSFLFNTSGAFAISLMHSMSCSILQNALVKEGDENVVLNYNLPHPVRLVKHQLSPSSLNRDIVDIPLTQFVFCRFRDIFNGSGILINTFHELEPVYIQHLKILTGKPVWAIGPVLPHNFLAGEGNASARGKAADISAVELGSWLASQNPRSVLYVSFGSHTFLSQLQTNGLARGLEASEQPFVWVIKVAPNVHPAASDSTELASTYLPQGFLERTKNRGLVIWGWAPQLVILSHPSVGAFMSHCGWNSTLESISLGVPIVAWPMFGDQHFNSKLVAELGVGIQFLQDKDGLPDEQIVKEAVRMALIEDKGNEMRSCVEILKESARKAVKNEGSSVADLQAFVSEQHKLNIRPRKSSRETETILMIPSTV